MAYATQDDIVALYSQNALYVADRDGDGVPDASAVARALDGAAAEIDSYLGVRYQLPVADPSGLLKQFSVDVALYRLALSRDTLTEEHRRRYDDVIKHLVKIAEGKATLNLPAPVDAETGEPASTSPRPIVAGGPERLFTRETTRGL